MDRKKVLIVDDEPDILELLSYNLEHAGFQVFTASNGEDGLATALKTLPDIIILDIMMPGMDGVEVCRQLRQNKLFADTFIMFLTARGEEYSEVAGFDAGADDYVVKPIRTRSLLKRLEVAQRRTVKDNESSEVLDFKELRIDKEKYLVYLEGKEIRLPKKEFELLLLLAMNKDKVIEREKIYEAIWGNDIVVVDRTIDVHVRRIRQKIGDDYIETVKGVGYKFVTP